MVTFQEEACAIVLFGVAVRRGKRREKERKAP